MATRRDRRGDRGPLGPPGLDALLAAKEMVLICGSGGVGKTTIAAALALAAAVQQGGKVLVLTIDPARRLADSLGIGALGNRATRVPLEAFESAGISPRGELWAAMLDTKAGWDDLIRRHAPDAQVREAVLSNPLYQNITSRFVHSHDYLAMEQLHDVHASGDYDLVVVDTPPSRNALDVLAAPSRMVEFFGSRLLKWLTVPYRSRLFNVASKPFNQIADRVLGSHFLQDIAQFFILFQAMEKGFVARAREVEALLGDPRTTFVIVSTLEAAPAHEAAFLARALTERRFQLGAIVANRVLPSELTARAAATSARRLADAAAPKGGEPSDLAERVAETLDASAPSAGADDAPSADAVGNVLGEIAARFHDVALVATREAERRTELAALAPQVLDVEALPSDVHDLAGLRAIVDSLV
jgi:anion-transporting  ArsA/GET3 family ATPase